MTIEEIKEKKIKLETTVNGMVNAFMKETDVSIDEIYYTQPLFQTIDSMSGQTTVMTDGAKVSFKVVI